MSSEYLLAYHCRSRPSLLGSFGYRDGISQPGIRRFTDLMPGQEAVPPGIALLRNPGDTKGFKRPRWSTDGSFLVFRYLQQLVPEFDDFLEQNPIVANGLTRSEGSTLRGCEYIGPLSTDKLTTDGWQMEIG
jgi:deferrochelatase/peroxidase EfeB